VRKAAPKLEVRLPAYSIVDRWEQLARDLPIGAS